MKQFNQIFYIYKSSYIKDELPEVSFIPMMMRRKLSALGKAALSVMYDIYEHNDIKLVFASNYGELDRVKKLLEQKKLDGEISPSGFSSSVHNAVVGLFSLLNKIKSSYNTISAGENTLSAGILESIITNEEVLFCYADTVEGLKSAACIIGVLPREDSVCVEFLPNNGQKPDAGFDAFIKFLSGSEEFVSDLYVLRKIK